MEKKETIKVKFGWWSFEFTDPGKNTITILKMLLIFFVVLVGLLKIESIIKMFSG